MNDAIFIFSLNIQQSNVDSITVFFNKNYTCHKSEFCFFSFFFLKVESGQVLKFKPKQTATCMPFSCQ